ncbi:MAG: class I SAM-dependent methyltransferase [Caldilineaceae bacterium]|nr:class I SAM-dependent methyltransferase [Caldilineaceae bacterium]
MEIDLQQANEETRQAWDANAAYWDAQMGNAGNDFVNELIWPAVTKLLALQPGERILDIACGNGLYARRLAAHGANVVAFDFAQSMIEHARQYTTEQATVAERISYHVCDATDEAALLRLGEGQFDGAICNMALMDMAEIDPLLQALARLFKPKGRLVFSITHPCFNQARAVHMAEMEDRNGEIITSYSIKIRGYMTPSIAHGAAIAGQPKPQLYFDRPLYQLLGAGFAAGFVVDGIEERAFAPTNPAGRNPLGWNGNFSEIPPVLVVRMRLPG